MTPYISNPIGLSQVTTGIVTLVLRAIAYNVQLRILKYPADF